MSHSTGVRLLPSSPVLVRTVATAHQIDAYGSQRPCVSTPHPPTASGHKKQKKTKPNRPDGEGIQQIVYKVGHTNGVLAMVRVVPP